MDKKQKNIALFSYAILIAALAVIAVILFTLPHQAVITPPPHSTTTIGPVTPRVLNQTELEGIFIANGTYSSSSSSEAFILNNNSVVIETGNMQFNFSKYGITSIAETIQFPTTSYSGYNLSSSYARSVSYFSNYTARLHLNSSTNQSGVLDGMTYTLFKSQTSSGSIQMRLIGYKGTTSISTDLTGFATSVTSGAQNTLVNALSQTV